MKPLKTYKAVTIPPYRDESKAAMSYPPGKWLTLPKRRVNPGPPKKVIKREQTMSEWEKLLEKYAPGEKFGN